jgi:hypothetical protein
VSCKALELPHHPRAKRPPIYVAPPFSWTGFYLGLRAAGARRKATEG